MVPSPSGRGRNGEGRGVYTKRSMLMRLQKALAQAGLASRRKAEQWIREGRVSVNGEIVTTLGAQADPAIDRIAVDGRLINRVEPKVYYLLNKPTGYVSTCEDNRGRPTVLDLLRPIARRLFPVGRLDWDTEGVLLLTNDGELAQRLLHPRYHIRRTYLAKVAGIPTSETLQRFAPVAEPPDHHERRSRVRIVRAGKRHAWVEIHLWEGRNRQVRRMCEAVGHPVKRLRRVRFAGLELTGLATGQYRPLTPAEVVMLKRVTGLDRMRTRAR
jgi:23S rRNA pseudouridine2605 synthase